MSYTKENIASKMSVFNELMYLVMEYDWAVEGFPKPTWARVERAEAIKIRNGLVRLSIALDEGE